MKLYSYLLCIAGKEPQRNGRLFQHKNLVLTEIKRCTGLEPKTVKLYLYDLELQGLVRFRGDREFSFNYINQDEFIEGGTTIDKKGFREAKQKEVFNKWKLRLKIVITIFLDLIPLLQFQKLLYTNLIQFLN